MPVSSRNWPLADPNRKWDGAAARARARKWASSDGSGDLDKVSLTKYGGVFFWRASSPKKLGDFKFPYADIINGGPKVVRAACQNALARVPGSNIPKEDKVKLQNAARRQLNRFKKGKKNESDEWASPIESLGDIALALENKDTRNVLAAYNLLVLLASTESSGYDREDLFDEFCYVASGLETLGVKLPEPLAGAKDFVERYMAMKDLDDEDQALSNDGVSSS